ncbi:MAG: Clp protease ClpP [Oscillospiraceae bacterium]|nr:Clp protease ClpP [Oscillospiraceae bacterium]
MNILSKTGRPGTSRTVTPASAFIQPYAFATGGDGVAEIELYGDIVSKRPVDWWTGEPIEGSFIILSDFLADLKKVETSKKLRIRIHSAGGNAYEALTIHNRLKEMSGKGVEIEVIVDGVAMSGGSLIMCAGDSVKVFPGSLVMIHCCWVFMFGGYNAAELRKAADSNDAVDRSQAAIYHAKTGLSLDELTGMLERETYMTGQEAIDSGFADEMVEGAALEIAASADRRTLFVGGMPVWSSLREGGIPTSTAS